MFSTSVKRKKDKTHSTSRGVEKADKKVGKAKDRRFNKKMANFKSKAWEKSLTKTCPTFSPKIKTQ